MATGGQEEVGCRLVRVRDLEVRSSYASSNYSCLVVSEDVIIAGENNTCSVHLIRRQDGRLLAKKDKLEMHPCGICVIKDIINDMEICVVLSNSHIQIMSVQYTINTGVISKVRTILAKTTFDYCTAAAKFTDKVIVSGLKQGSICWCIVSLIDGNVDTIHKICEGKLSFVTTNKSIIYISCLADLNSPQNTGVYAYDIQRPSIKKFVYKHKELEYPKGITVDTRGFIFVCNNGDIKCIHHLTRRCELVTIYREKMPSSLHSMFCDQPQGYLYVTRNWSTVISQFRLEYSHEQGDHKAPEIQESERTPALEETSTQIEHISKTEEVKFETIYTRQAGSETEEVLPPEILKMDESFQMLYREVLAAGKEKVYNIRLMIVGHQGVGKTSLTQRLLAKQVKENETESTEGIEVHTRCCQIDHATGEWKTEIETDELFLNDQRIASILKKYESPQSNHDIQPTDIVTGIPPRKKPRLSLHNATAVTSSLDGNTENIVSQISKEADHITESEDVQSCHLDNSGHTGNMHDEAEQRTFPEEIKNFVKRAESLPVPKGISSYVTLLDFAGQSLFYTIHQAFMSWRTLYILVTDMSLPLTDAVQEGAHSIDVSGKRICSIQDYVTYWLNSIHSHVLLPEDVGRCAQGTTRNRPFVILVGTHADKIPKDSLEQRKKSYFNDIRNVLKNRPLLFHLVDEDFAVSNLGSDPSIKALKSKIFETAQKQKYWGEEIPARWIPLERILMEVKASGIQVLDYAALQSLNETLQVRIERPEELDLFLGFEHDLGNIIFFNTERLRKKVVLDPEWLLHGVRIWITSDQVIHRHPELSQEWSAFKDTGRLTSTLIEKLWSPHAEVLQHKEYLLEVMENLNIIAKPLQTKEEEYYWVPCMVSMPAPDDMKKLQQNKDTTKTSTLCFLSKTNFIHVGVFHRLLATCLSKWAPAKEGNTTLIFRGLCVFNLDEQQQLILSLNDFVIQATVIRFTKKGLFPDLPLCITIREELYNALSDISECLCRGSEFEICIKCKESSPYTNEGMHSISTLRTKDEFRCDTHKEAHCVVSGELLGSWEEQKKEIPASVLPHSLLARSQFTRLSSLVLDVGSKVLRKVLLYYSTASGYTLDQYMNNNKQNILKLQKKHVLTQAQVDIIFPRSGQTDIDEYDITLASALLINIYPSLGQQGKKYIEALRAKRNELAHSSSTRMTEQDFQTKWTEITTILTDLSKLCNDPNFDNKVQKEIQDIQQSGSFEILSNLPAITEELKKVCKILKETATI